MRSSAFVLLSLALLGCADLSVLGDPDGGVLDGSVRRDGSMRDGAVGDGAAPDAFSTRDGFANGDGWPVFDAPPEPLFDAPPRDGEVADGPLRDGLVRDAETRRDVAFLTDVPFGDASGPLGDASARDSGPPGFDVGREPPGIPCGGGRCEPGQLCCPGVGLCVPWGCIECCPDIPPGM